MLHVLSGMNWAMVFGVLWGVAEALALVPGIKSNSVFTLFYNVIKFCKEKLAPAQS